MSVTFSPNNPNNEEDYVNLSNSNACRVLDRMGLRADVYGECEADTFVYLCNKTLDKIFAGTPGYTREDRETMVYFVSRLTALRDLAYYAYVRDAGAVVSWA